MSVLAGKMYLMFSYMQDLMTDFETVQLIYFIDKEYGIVIGIGLFDDNKLETFKTEHLTKVFDSAWGEIVCTVIDQFGIIRDFFSNSNKSEIRNCLFTDIEPKLSEDDVFFIKILIGICLKL